MGDFPYIDNIPLSTNRPSQDQPNMQINTNSIDSLINEDHISFNVQNGGYHKLIRQNMFSTITSNPPDNDPPTLPGGVMLGFGRLVEAEVNNPPGSANTDSNLYYISEQGRAFQITGFQDTNNNQASFNTNGYCVMGPILFQWGQFTMIAGSSTHSTATVLFATANIDFPNACLNVEAVMVPNNTTQTSSNNTLSIFNFTKTGFTYVWNGTNKANYPSFNWFAVGY